jgi:hypothetical protein
MAEQKFQLQEGVTGKYLVNPSFLGGRKLIFPLQHIHKVAHKPAHELTLEEIDRLVAAGAVKGIFTLKAKTVAAIQPEKEAAEAPAETAGEATDEKPKRNYRRRTILSES